ncbi:CPBP family intramembrane glutamic endopeptidase [Exiguobacterium sp. s80]|uniref:CPBP family intramembrane glutamic endopeptidase n=1 Tax=Exiguobacterium sp. s80 TaxID=2751209 RepID=UPI001BEBD8C5|nr:type II CAAX endopeptidase family protein [Exiguobacterium sp. s80]
MKNSVNLPFNMADKWQIRHIIPIVIYLIVQLVPGTFRYFIPENQIPSVVGWWLAIGFTVAVIVSFFCLRPDWQKWKAEGNQTDPIDTLKWIGIGIVLLYALLISVNLLDAWMSGGLENVAKSQNTDDIMKAIQVIPILQLMVVLLGPIMEEFLFRHIMFGNLSTKLNFVFSFVLSGVIFGFIHGDNKFLIYVAMSFVFSLVFVKTRRIIAPIAIHVFNNGIVVLALYAMT